MNEKARALLVAQYAITHQVRAFREWARKAEEKQDLATAKRWTRQAEAYEESYSTVSELYCAAIREAKAQQTAAQVATGASRQGEKP